MKMRRATIALVSAMVAVTGCTSSTDDLSPNPQRSTGSVLTASPTTAKCQRPEITLGVSSARIQTVTGARKLVITATRTTETNLRDEPVRPALSWQAPPGLDDAMVWVVIGEQGITQESSPGVTNVVELLRGLEKKAGSYVGYAGVTRVTMPLTVTCANGFVVTGEVTAWTDPEVGAVGCGQALPANAPEVARMVLADFC